MTPILTTEQLLKLRGSPESMLDSGYKLSRDEFIRRYEARPDIRRAELLGGIVYIMSSPISNSHSAGQVLFLELLGRYARGTPGTQRRGETTVHLTKDSTVQPDGLLLIDQKFGGRVTLEQDDYFHGAPELIVEVSIHTAAYDLHLKKEIYESAGVREYIVWEALDHRLHWFSLGNSASPLIVANSDGIFKSQMFPGLWIDGASLTSGNETRALEILEQGLASPEHAAFVSQLNLRAQGKQ